MTEEKFLQSLGKRIKKKRISLEIGQTEMANKINIARTHLFRIERGDNPTSVIVLRRIAKSFDMKISELLDFE